MVSLLNSTCAKFEDVPRSGSRYDLEAALLYVKGTWLPSEFTVSVCDGSDAWTGKATEEFVVENASRLGLTESEYVDRVQLCFSRQHPDVKYELKWCKSLSPELICVMPHQQLVLKLQTTTDSGPRVAADMVQLLLDAHHGLTEELAQKTRGFEREIAVKERSLTVLQKQLDEGNESLKDGTNGHVNEGKGEGAALKATAGTSSRVKRKGSASTAETGSRKRTSKISEPLPLFQKPVEEPLLLEKSLAIRPLPLSALGYKQQSKEAEGRETPKVRNWADTVTAGRSNGVTDDSLSEGKSVGGRKAFLDHLGDLAELKTDPLPARKASKKRTGRSGVRKANKIPLPQPSLDDSLDQVEDVVKKGIQCVDNITPSQNPLEVSSPVTTPVKPQRKPPASGKKPPSKEKKPKIQAPARSSRKKVKPIVVESDEASEPEPEPEPAESEPSEAPEIVAGPAPGADEDREIDVQNAEFNDFDASRTEGSFEEGQFWALYDDQDGMPRFYGHVTGVHSEPFQVSVEWLEPFKPNCPATTLVKTAKLSPSCGDFTFGAVCLQDLAAFSHVVDVDRDPKRSMVSFWPRKDEIWALYRHWDKKQAKKEDGDQTFYYEYDLVQVTSNFSSSEGLNVEPLIKVDGFKSLFTVSGEKESYHIPSKQVQVRFSHYIPQHLMLGSESPGVPPGAWELDPASTPSDYLGSVAPEGNADNAN